MNRLDHEKPMKTQLLGASSIFEIKDHLENTQKDMIKAYDGIQIAVMDRTSSATIKKKPTKYIPIRVDDRSSLYKYRNGQGKKPYMKKYIRLDELRTVFHNLTGKYLAIVDTPPIKGLEK